MVTVTQTLTDAQIKALPTTPFTLIPAPPSGLRIKVLGASLRSSFAAGAYTNINATLAEAAIYYLGDFTQWAAVGLVDDATYVAHGAHRFSNVFGVAGARIVDLGPYVDTPSDGLAGDLWTLPNVQILASTNGTALAFAINNNGSGNLIDGNVANSMTVTVYYVQESVV